eukprot:scaffold110603_cov34-Tisochrysis_lutea.AAC.5
MPCIRVVQILGRDGARRSQDWPPFRSASSGPVASPRAHAATHEYCSTQLARPFNLACHHCALLLSRHSLVH